MLTSLLLASHFAVYSSVADQTGSPDPSPAQILLEMTRALSTLSYEGTFLYQSQDQVKTIRRSPALNFDLNLKDNDNYRLISSPYDRVADRETYVIEVKSIDKYRYSYRFWFDKRSFIQHYRVVNTGRDFGLWA